MATVGAATRQRITEIAAMLDNHRINDAYDTLLVLLKDTPVSVVALIAPDLSGLIERFYKQKKRLLTEALSARLAKLPAIRVMASGTLHSARPSMGPALRLPLQQEYALLLKELGERHIFQWANQYRDALDFIFSKTLNELGHAAQWHAEVDGIGEEFAIHTQDIFTRGFSFQVGRGLSPEVAEIKGISGLQNFLYYVVLIFAEHRDVQSSRDAQLVWGLASCVLTGILRGYGRSRFGQRLGWTLLQRNLRIWLAPLGFCRGGDALALLDEFPASDRDSDLYITILPTLLAIESLANRFHREEVFLPRLCRVSVLEPPRLDITLSLRREGVSHETLVSTFFSGVVEHEMPISDALSLHAVVVVGQLGEKVRSWVDLQREERILDAKDVMVDSGQVQEFSELVYAQLESQTKAYVEASDPTLMTRNYASEFPLDDPDFRRQFLVERHSVKRLLQQIEGSNGIHLWCSIRRSGKTTAASTLADPHGRSVVVMQSMDQLPKQQLEQNIFKRRLKEAFKAREEIEPDFFQSIVDECVLATTSNEAPQRRVVFILDEYETLFGIVNAYVSDESGLKFKVALPLLSQMVAFAAKNLLIFMGQRPDAYLILSAQNQLSPLVKQYNFPLFDHIEGAADTEFTQLLKRVLTDRLPFHPSFSSSVYEETCGHPYLTVNLMVDFCDWLIANNHRMDGEILDSTHFVNFGKERLVATKLKRSPRYEFFNHMLAEYLSESGRTQEPWLSAITSVLQEIARKHPRAFACPINNFEALAAPFGAATRMTPARLLTSGSLANFLQDQGGNVKPGVRLLARLAGSAAPNIN